jgi:hypothetical protein
MGEGQGGGDLELRIFKKSTYPDNLLCKYHPPLNPLPSREGKSEVILKVKRNASLMILQKQQT